MLTGAVSHALICDLWDLGRDKKTRVARVYYVEKGSGHDSPKLVNGEFISLPCVCGLGSKRGFWWVYLYITYP
jgi:hypothetical protein